MTSLIASVLLAAVIPSDFLDSVGLAAYWYRKDSRGRGDPISEEGVPRRVPAFAVADDTFVLPDLMVRERHLDRIEFWYDGRRYPAKEIARGEFPDTVLIRTDRAVEGVRPLAFVKGDPVERLTCRWHRESLDLRSSPVGTNSDVRVDLATRRAYHTGESDSLMLDKDRRPVGIDFGEITFVDGDRFEYADPVARCTLPADSFEKAATAIEERALKAVLPIVLRLEQQEKTVRRRFSWSDDEKSATESDALGLVLGGRVLVPCSLSGEDIARFKSAEATFADGTKTNLVFAGVLNEWNAIVFDLPEGCADKVTSLAVSTADPASLFTARAWSVCVDNEGGRPVADALRSVFNGVEFLRGAKFAAIAGFENMRSRGWSRSDDAKSRLEFLTDGAGAVTSLELGRRYGGRWSSGTSTVCPADLADALAGKGFNPEFRPRAEEDRGRVVWLGVETVELTEALAREKKAQGYIERYSHPPLVTEVYSNSPCAKAGIRAGDILLAYRRGTESEQSIRSYGDYSGRDWSVYFGNDELFSVYGITATPWTDVENETNRELTKFGVGAKVALVYVRDGKRCETELTLDAAPSHYKNATKSRNRALGTLVKDMTFEVRRFFKFDDQAPGVVIAKIKPGSPAAVAGLKVYELITEVNGEKVTGAKDFAAKVKDRKDLVFTVRRLSQTRMVKIHVQ